MKTYPENCIPKQTQQIAKRQAYKYFTSNWVRLKRWCDHEDLVQVIYERLLRDNLLKCSDHGLIYVVANRACIDFCRSTIPGHRQRRGFDIVEYEDAVVKIYDSKYYEIMSLNQLLEKLPKIQRIVTKNLIKNYTLKEIGAMVNLTEARICQIKKEIIGKLFKLYKEEE